MENLYNLLQSNKIIIFAIIGVLFLLLFVFLFIYLIKFNKIKKAPSINESLLDEKVEDNSEESVKDVKETFVKSSKRKKVPFTFLKKKKDLLEKEQLNKQPESEQDIPFSNPLPSDFIPESSNQNDISSIISDLNSSISDSQSEKEEVDSNLEIKQPEEKINFGKQAATQLDKITNKSNLLDILSPVALNKNVSTEEVLASSEDVKQEDDTTKISSAQEIIPSIIPDDFDFTPFDKDVYGDNLIPNQFALNKEKIANSQDNNSNKIDLFDNLSQVSPPKESVISNNSPMPAWLGNEDEYLVNESMSSALKSGNIKDFNIKSNEHSSLDKDIIKNIQLEQ